LYFLLLWRATRTQKLRGRFAFLFATKIKAAQLKACLPHQTLQDKLCTTHYCKFLLSKSAWVITDPKGCPKRSVITEVRYIRGSIKLRVK
jgi:hypothetical protein